MVGITGLGGVPEPTPERPANVRDRKRTDLDSAKQQDGVTISSEAQKAADVGKLIQASSEMEDVRLQKVAMAKESIESGDYKKPEVVAEVARRIIKLLEV